VVIDGVAHMFGLMAIDAAESIVKQEDLGLDRYGDCYLQNLPVHIGQVFRMLQEKTRETVVTIVKSKVRQQLFKAPDVLNSFLSDRQVAFQSAVELKMLYGGQVIVQRDLLRHISDVELDRFLAQTAFLRRNFNSL